MNVESSIKEVLKKHEDSFKAGKTLGLDFRLKQLNQMVVLLKENAENIIQAFRSDFKKVVSKNLILSYPFLISMLLKSCMRK
ncbi:hypothetical protein HZS_731 [Henneguya salminicola]|nr:hypothetical protein HZS_731 [Henneguya salminicola]